MEDTDGHPNVWLTEVANSCPALSHHIK